MGDNEGQVRLGGNMSVIRALQEIRDAVEGTYGPHKIVVYPGGRVTVNGGDVKGGAGWPEYLRLVAGALESRCPAPLLDWILEHSEEVPRDRS